MKYVYDEVSKQPIGVYLIPQGKFGFTDYPVSKKVLVKDEQGNLHAQEELLSGAAVVTLEQYQALLERKAEWKDGSVQPIVQTSEEVAASNLLVEVAQKKNAVSEALNWLREADYVGIKIAHALLIGTPEDLQQLRDKYGSILEEAQSKRDIVNANERWLAENAEAIDKAQALLAAEESS